MMKEYFCIYRVTNKINGKTYIGQHKYIDDENPMKGYVGSGKLLHRAYKKYGQENFSIEVLYKRVQYQETADSMEIWMIDKERKSNKNGIYNICKGGSTQRSFLPEFMAEIAKKSSETQKRNNAKMTKEERSERFGNFAGHKHSPESIEKMSKTSKRKWLDEDYRKKRCEAVKRFYENGGQVWNKGKTGIFSDDTKKRLAECGKKKIENIKSQLPEGWVLVSEFSKEINKSRAIVLSHYECKEFFVGKNKLTITNRKEKEFVDNRGKWKRK